MLRNSPRLVAQSCSQIRRASGSPPCNLPTAARAAAANSGFVLEKLLPGAIAVLDRVEHVGVRFPALGSAARCNKRSGCRTASPSRRRGSGE